VFPFFFSFLAGGGVVGGRAFFFENLASRLSPAVCDWKTFKKKFKNKWFCDAVSTQ
jgi:hypothetical protein